MKLGPHPGKQTLHALLPPVRDFPFPPFLSLSFKVRLEAAKGKYKQWHGWCWMEGKWRPHILSFSPKNK